MVIGFDGSRAFQKERTGTENYSYQLLKVLAKIDQKNRYIIYTRPAINSAIITNNVSWPDNFQFKIINWPKLWTQGGLALQTFKDQLDVLFVPAHTLPLIKKLGLKTVVTVHDLGSEYLPSMHQLKQRLYLGFMQKIQLRTAFKIIAVSKATKEDLIKRIGIKSEKISVVYEGYDRNLFKPIKNDVLVNSLRQYGLKAGGYFLFVGTVQPRKNLERLIQAFLKYTQLIAARHGTKNRSTSKSQAFRDSLVSLEVRQLTGSCTIDSPHFLITHDFAAPDLVIVGNKGWMSDDIYQLPKKLGIEDRVKFLGYVMEKDLPDLYSGAIALTFPSLFEGFGLPVLEAQACGIPVITSNLSSMPEVGSSPAGGGAIYVNPYDVDDIVKGMNLINNKEARNKLIKNGFENVKRFSWEKCVQETLAVLEGI